MGALADLYLLEQHRGALFVSDKVVINHTSSSNHKYTFIFRTYHQLSHFDVNIAPLKYNDDIRGCESTDLRKFSLSITENI